MGFIDCGELAAAASTLGIPHPTGYPLFTLLGWVVVHFPWGPEEIVRLNWMAAFFCALGSALSYRLVLTLLNGPGGRSKEKGTQNNPSSLMRAAAAGAALTLAFSETYWSQAVSVEVYSLHVLLLVVVLFVFFRAAHGEGAHWWEPLFCLHPGSRIHEPPDDDPPAPGLIYYYFATQGGSRDSWIRLLRLGPPFLLGLSVYA